MQELLQFLDYDAENCTFSSWTVYDLDKSVEESAKLRVAKLLIRDPQKLLLSVSTDLFMWQCLHSLQYSEKKA